MKLQHTPGPWECNYNLRTAINAGEKHIAMVNFFNDGSDSRSVCGDEHEANARIITAAPNVPHECDDPKCPGNINRQKLALYDEMERVLHETLKHGVCSHDIKEILDRVEALK